MKIKILVYNIGSGFSNNLWERDGKTSQKRLNLVKKVIKSEKPDILVLNEATKMIKEFNNYIDYQKEFAFKHISHDYRSNMILSNFKLEGKRLLPFGDLYGLINKVKLAKNKYVHVITARPHPANDQEKKLKNFKRMFLHIPTNYRKRLILASDINCVSDKDNYDRKRLTRGFKKITSFYSNMGTDPEEVVKDIMSPKVIPWLRKIGLHDTYSSKISNKVDITHPTKLDDKFIDAGMRIDFILAPKHMKVVDAYIIKNKDTERASDHYPIVAILEV